MKSVDELISDNVITNIDRVIHNNNRAQALEIRFRLERRTTLISTEIELLFNKEIRK